MANDTKTKKGGGWTGKARASAVSRLIAARFGLKPSVTGCGISVTEQFQRVHIDIYLGDADHQRKETRRWIEEITKILVQAGYEVSAPNSGTLTVTKADWRFKDMVFAKLPFTSHHHVETDAGLLAAPPRVVRTLRDNGWIKPDNLELTDLGQQVRAYLLKLRHKKNLAEKRRLRERGW